MARLFILLFFCSFTCIVKAQYNKDITIEPLLKTDTNAIGQKISYPSFKNDEVTILKVTIPPGKSTGWHKHLFPVFAYVLQGTLTVSIENHASVELKANSTFPEVLNTFHNGMNNGDIPVVLIAFYMGEKGRPLSVKKE